jgi:hypothetical protein
MIPAFDLSNVLPPFVGATAVIENNMSPYKATMVEVTQRFGTSPERIEILDGLLRYRSALFSAGLVEGFQWLDGSFVENIEAIETRPPHDVDVVTFYHHHVPDAEWQTWLTANLHLFNPIHTKATYKCDVYGVDLQYPPEVLVSRTRYWFGLFSHQRGGINRVWKGMVQVPLSPNDDALAQAALQERAP